MEAGVSEYAASLKIRNLLKSLAARNAKVADLGKVVYAACTRNLCEVFASGSGRPPLLPPP